ncbi:unnamed protein product, partial [Amoebophrya sp. A25]
RAGDSSLAASKRSSDQSSLKVGSKRTSKTSSTGAPGKRSSDSASVRVLTSSNTVVSDIDSRSEVSRGTEDSGGASGRAPRLPPTVGSRNA